MADVRAAMVARWKRKGSMARPPALRVTKPNLEWWEGPAYCGATLVAGATCVRMLIEIYGYLK